MPSLYNDLYMVYQFQKFQQVPQLVQRDPDEKSARLDAEDKTSDIEVKEESGSDSDEDPQSGEGDCVSSILIQSLSLLVSVRWMLNQGFGCVLRQTQRLVFT